MIINVGTKCVCEYWRKILETINSKNALSLELGEGVENNIKV
jgi:hypothetical protein